METTPAEVIEQLPLHFKAPVNVSSQVKALALLTPTGEDALADPAVDVGLLVIIFSSGGWYGYKDVPKAVAQGCLDAPSAGKFLAQHVKAKADEHPCSRFTDELVAVMKAKQ